MKLRYCNRALEWLNFRQIFHDLLVHFHFDQLCPILEDVVFAWSYIRNISTILYKPASVFKHFSFVHLFDDSIHCACTTATRFHKFIDPLTTNEVSDLAKSIPHVRTMDLSIIQHKGLCDIVAQGLNHIPPLPTNIGHAIATVLEAYEQLTSILQLESMDFPLVEARVYLHTQCLEILKQASKINKYDFRISCTHVLNDPVVQNEI